MDVSGSFSDSVVIRRRGLVAEVDEDQGHQPAGEFERVRGGPFFHISHPAIMTTAADTRASVAVDKTKR